MEKKKIAILTPDLSVLNGVAIVAKYIHEIINSSDKFSADLISLSTSARDSSSVRLTKPKTWSSGVKIENKTFQSTPFRHVGANLTEIEFCRYRPRRALDEVLRHYDLVQIIAGLPMWALAANNFSGKLALQMASLTAIERETTIAAARQPRRAWMQTMSAINRTLEERAIKRADAIFVYNDWLYKLLIKDFKDKVIFAPPGIDTDFLIPIENGKNDYILSVGRFSDARKNVQLLFRAYKKILDKLGESTPNLVLAGQTAPSAADLGKAEEMGIRHRIEILTEVSKEKLRELYQNASVFVLSSNEEGFGLIIAEAMACGLAVVSTKCGGPEVIVTENETGFLTPIGDAEALAEKVSLLLADETLRKQFGSAGRKRAFEKFSRRATETIYLETYERLLNL